MELHFNTLAVAAYTDAISASGTGLETTGKSPFALKQGEFNLFLYTAQFCIAVAFVCLSWRSLGDMLAF